MILVEGYSYALYATADLTDEILVWHWHPDSRSAAHVHVNARSASSLRSLRRLHVPTAKIAFEQVARFLIEDVAVSPARPDWAEVLSRGEEQFRHIQGLT